MKTTFKKQVFVCRQRNIKINEKNSETSKSKYTLPKRENLKKSMIQIHNGVDRIKYKI